ncbi:magnesium transporter [Thermodesulfobacteriota bacterium]
MNNKIIERPWKDLKKILVDTDVDRLKKFLDELSPAETALAISRLSSQEQSKLLMILEPVDAADVIEDISETQAADLIEDLPVASAAAIVDEITSDRQADLLGELEKEEAEAIIDEMSPDEAEGVRRLLKYDPDTAGGLMITEYVAYNEKDRVSDVLLDLQVNRETYKNYNVQYLYVKDKDGKLTGVLRMRDLFFESGGTVLSDFMITRPLYIRDSANIKEFREFIDEHKLFGVPVVDAENRLVGVVLPRAVEEASLKEADHQFLGFSGIIGGEEFRTMPLLVRSGRRFSWLSINIVLNIIAASVIAYYQDTLAAVIALAVFLPMISDMSGCSGNQSVAVSMRELTLGLIRPKEILRVVSKEVWLGAINGLALGILLGGAAILWKGNLYLGLVVGGALMANTMLAVVLGGSLPLLLKFAKLDPALVSSPILTTVTDMCGFFLVLSFATVLLPRLI